MKSILFSDVKRFMKNIVNQIFILQLITLILLSVYVVRQEKSTQQLSENIKKAEKKVDFRYFNITRSLEDIHNIKIETKDGRIIKSFSK